ARVALRRVGVGSRQAVALRLDCTVRARHRQSRVAREQRGPAVVVPDMSPADRVPLSVLELVPRSQGMSASEALQHSTTLATRLDQLGYHRLWVAEHHGTEAFLSSATSLILGHFAHHTEGIRLGSGGVMLPNHSP